jgi:hypothetical protein
VTAFDHRKKALEMEVILWQAGYWALPYVGVTNSIEKQVAGLASEKQREELRRRKRG